MAISEKRIFWLMQKRLNQINVVSSAYAHCHLLLRLCSKLY